MLLTAQRVAPSASAKEGVNAFLYRHGTQAVPNMNWEHPLLPVVVDDYPGTLVHQSLDVPPGGNRVRAYLDVVCKDDTPPAVIDNALDAAARDLSEPTIGHSVVRGPVAVRFFLERGLMPRAQELMGELRAAAMRLLTNPPLTQPARPSPVVVEVEYAASCRILELSNESRRLLAATRSPGEPVAPRTIKLDHDMAAELPPQFAPFYLQLASVLTGLSLEKLYARGGIRVVRKGSNEVEWSWPQDALDSGWCLGCHQHRTLVQEAGGTFRCLNCGHAQGSDGAWAATLGG